MNARHKYKKFRLVEIDGFDARRGYKRCTLPGVSVNSGPWLLNAYFWRDKSGRLVVRFACRGYVFHSEASTTLGRKISENELRNFGDYVAERLMEWLDEGIDDLPGFLYES